MKSRWLFISRQDPRNLIFANRAGFIATVEWILIIGGTLAVPSDAGRTSPTSWLVLSLAAMLLLTFAGYRGLISGYKHRMGSLVLLTTNLFAILLFSYLTVSNYLHYYHD